MMWRTLIVFALVVIAVFGLVALSIWLDPRRRRMR